MALLESSDSLLLATRRKWNIPNQLRLERNPAALKASVELIHDLFPDAILRSITATYNCVGLVVASRRTWVDPEHFLPILTDDGYRQLNGADETEMGDIVIYRDDDGYPCHTGIVVRKNILVEGEQQELLTVLSKWGADGEYIHGASRLPEWLGSPSEFWTDRRIP